MAKRKAKRAPPLLPTVDETDDISFPGKSAGQSTFEHSPTLGQLAVALVGFQSQLRVIGHDKRGFQYTYTTLGNILETISESMAEYGLAISQVPVAEADRVGVTTVLLHESGEYLLGSYTLPIPDPTVGVKSGKEVLSKTQRAGVALSYARRYAIAAILCIATEADTDGVA